LRGGDDNDSLYGNGGNDMIEGEAGSDTLSGGTGDDRIEVHDGNGTALIDGGTDTDTVVFSDATGNGISTTFTGAGSFTYVYDTVATSGSASAVEALRGTSGSDSIDAGANSGAFSCDLGGGSDSFAGGTAAETISGGAGDDRLTLGTGADTLGFSDGDGADTVTDFDMTDDGFGRTLDQIDVSALTDADGNPVNAWDVDVINDGSGNALLTFPNGETLTLIGIPHTSVSSAKTLYAMGTPALSRARGSTRPPAPTRSRICARAIWCGCARSRSGPGRWATGRRCGSRGGIA